MFRENKKQQYSRNNNSHFVRTSCKKKVSSFWRPILVGGFNYFFFTHILGKFPIWLIFFKWVETTNQNTSLLVEPLQPLRGLPLRRHLGTFRGIRDESCSEDQVDGAEKLYDHAVTLEDGVFLKTPVPDRFFLEWRNPYETTPIKMAGL